MAVARLGVESGVVVGHGKAAVTQKMVDALDGFARAAVDDAGFFLFQEAQQGAVFVLWLEHGEMEIGPVKAGDVAEGIAQPQLGDDVLAHLGCGCRGEGGKDGALGKILEELGDAHVAGAKIVAPLAHTMRFVHGDHCHVQAGEGFPKAFELQPLWRDIEQIQLAGARQAHRFGEMLGRRGAGQRARCHAHFHEPVLLVLHQRDERRDHERQPRHADRRDLVAQRFSAACRQDRQGVAPAHQGGDDLPLAGTEGIVAKIFFQCLFWCHGRASFVSFPHYTTKSQRLQDVIQISLDSVARIP